MNKTFVIAAAAIATFTTPAVAGDVPSATIPTNDLDLTQQADREILDQRIDSTARRICATGAFDTQSRKMERACRLNVKMDAAPKVQLVVTKARTERLASISFDFHG